MLKIVNDGAAIASTNYFDSEHAKAGYYYLSWNAGEGRVLVPDARASDLREMATGTEVIVSVGPWPDVGGRAGLELLFEDGSDAPFCLHLSHDSQTDRTLPDSDQGGGFFIAAWSRDGMQGRWPGKFRRVSAIPCMDPWQEH